jgi:aspartate/methionine/tyrosine aminotransferase
MLTAGCQDDVLIVKWLAHKRGVAVIPGSGCGMPGHIRVAFGRPKEFGAAASRLKSALTDLVREGPTIADGV